MSIFTYIAYLHARQADCASDKCFMDTVQAGSVEEAEEAILNRHETDDPEIIVLIEGEHSDAR
jgi:hypothetical protein